MLPVTEAAFDGAHLSVPQVVDRDAIPYLAIAVSGPMSQLPQFAPPKFRQLHDWMKANGVPMAGDGFFRYRRFGDNGVVDLEVGTTTRGTAEGEGEILSSALPAGRYAVATYTGPYDRLYDATCMLDGWIRGRGLESDVSSGPDGQEPTSQVETYRVSPMDSDDPARWVTELALKIAD